MTVVYELKTANGNWIRNYYSFSGINEYTRVMHILEHNKNYRIISFM